jgi:histidyl-tRNA synthetase
MYTWDDAGRAQSDKGQSLTLRPENTASVVRAYIEHKLWERGLQKLYYIGPQFRRERPQKGRYRQFYQIGAEVIGPTTAGSESPARATRKSSNCWRLCSTGWASKTGHWS